MIPTVAEALQRGSEQLTAGGESGPPGAAHEPGSAEAGSRASDRHASDSPALDAQLLLCAVLQRPRAWLYTWPEKRLSEVQWQRYQALLAERLAGMPVAYLLGEREFWSLPLKVNRHTLIPRPDTEQLVEQALALDLPVDARVLDLGTGTGAIALALASERPHWRVTGCDRLPQAVALARENAQVLGLAAVSFLQSDWFSALSGQGFDLVVANPPYIAANDPHLQQGDVRVEPHSALVAGNEGMADLLQILAAAPGYLHPGGWLLMEHGWTQGAPLRQALSEQGYHHVLTRHDLAGQPRVSGGQWSPDGCR